MPKQARALVVFVESNRKTCGDCHFLVRHVTGGTDDEWLCDLWGADAHLGLVSHMKTPNRAPICLNAEKAAEGT